MIHVLCTVHVCIRHIGNSIIHYNKGISTVFFHPPDEIMAVPKYCHSYIACIGDRGIAGETAIKITTVGLLALLI